MVVVPRSREAPGSAARPSPQILVIDSQPLVLAALSHLLSCPPMTADVRWTTRSDEAVELVREAAVELVICDIKAEPISGAELPAMLAGARPATRVVLLAEPGDEPLLIASLQSGAAGFFTKDTAVEEFLEGLDAVREGHYVVGRNLVHRALARLSNRDPEARPGIERLSIAERSILTLVGQAVSVRSIATTRGISQKTVRNHLANIYRKLEVHNRTEVVLWAARMGMAAQREAPA